MRAVRLSRNGEYLFVGIVTSYYYDFQLAGFNVVNVQCADDFYKLAQTQLNEWNVTAQTSSQRITSVLALPEVDYPTIQVQTFYPGASPSVMTTPSVA